MSQKGNRGQQAFLFLDRRVDSLPSRKRARSFTRPDVHIIAVLRRDQAARTKKVGEVDFDDGTGRQK